MAYQDNRHHLVGLGQTRTQVLSPGKARTFKMDSLKDGSAWAPRNWILVTSDTGVGNPGQATVERGRAFFEAITGKIGDFLVELAAADVEDLYE